MKAHQAIAIFIYFSFLCDIVKHIGQLVLF